jgi:hypothetical protein
MNEETARIHPEEMMSADKKGDGGSKGPALMPPGASGARKAWTPKTPVEVILDQIKKQEKKVAELQQELDAEKTMLTKLLQAKKVLEGI